MPDALAKGFRASNALMFLVVGQARLYGRGEAEAERSPCPVCLGDYKLCRLDTCPYLRHLRSLLGRVESSRVLFGSSPPSSLVGSWGYPRIYVGPLTPPLIEDTSLMERPELWLDIPLEKILSMRLSLVRGKIRADVREAREPGRILQLVQELGMAYTPTDVELWFSKEPRIMPGFMVRSAPWGPSASIEKAVLASNPPVPRIVEKIVSDIDLKASRAVVELYRSGVSLNQIVRLLSLGLIGTKRWRRLVPTEWSITAVDDQIGKWLRRRVKENSWINSYHVYGHEAHHNKVSILMLPGPWMFEVIEIWHKGGVRIYRDHELPGEPDRYPEEVGGAFHALRLPVLEHLYKIRRQASVIVVAEVREGWIPLGVWRFREICRRALGKAETYDGLDEALNALDRHTWSPRILWERNSVILRLMKSQVRLTRFVGLGKV